MSDFNAQVIEEFRANEGRVGGPFEGAPMVLVHHTGRRSGEPRVSPMMYLPGPDGGAGEDTIFVFASKAGAPIHPDWYHNLVATGRGSVEVGTDAHDVTVTELTGEDRDRVYAEQASRYPGFAEYAAKTAGIRRIPVLRLTRT